MASFFSRIQSQFDTTHGGRYVAMILGELILEDKNTARVLFDDGRIAKCTADPEWSFVAQNGNMRRADLAIFSGGKHSDQDFAKPTGLVEIKYDDHKNANNSAQADDYLAYCARENVRFLLLTQHVPPPGEIQKVRDAGHRFMLFSDFATDLEKCANVQGLAKLFIDYVKDKGLMMDEIDPTVLTKLLKRMFNPYQNEGRSQNNADMIMRIPEAFKSLMSNINIIGQEVSRQLGITRSAAIDFRLSPWYRLSKKKVGIFSDSMPEEGIELERKERTGGIMYAYATRRLHGSSTDPWLSLQYGYELDIGKGADEFTPYLYAMMRAHGWSNYQHRKILHRTMGDKTSCVHKLTRLVAQAIDEALGRDNLLEVHRKRLRELRKLPCFGDTP